MDQDQKRDPLIGICISDSKRFFRGLVKRRIQRFSSDVSILKFRIEDLDFHLNTIIGELWEKKGGNISRKQGVFPLPDAIFIQCEVAPQIIKQIEKAIGRKVFNNFFFNKWEGWNLLVQDGGLKAHLPETRKWEKNVDLQSFLTSHKDIFIKPIDLYASKGIFRVKLKKDDKIEVFYQSNKEIQSKEFDALINFMDWISPQISDRSYILQESIQTMTWNNKVSDIRLNMSKNAKGIWDISLLFFRIAANGQFLAPSPDNLTITLPQLKKILPCDKTKEMDIVRLGYQICKTFDQSGYHMADLGIDLGVDEHGHLWIFEVNPLPAPFRGGLWDHSMTRPLEYGLYLAKK